MQDDEFILIESDLPPVARASNPYWKLLIVDDDPSVHAATRFALSNRQLLGRAIEFLHAYSAAEAKSRLAESPDIALVLLDVVMESSHAGLDLIRDIRDELRNNEVRIVLRTGQPGYAPEEEVVQALDINDYKLKTDLQHPKLLTCIASALRSYRQIHELAESRREIERQRRHLQQAQYLAQVGSWHLDLDRKTLNWSEEALRMLGHPPNSAPSLEDTLSAVHPDDQTAVASHREALAELDEYQLEFATTDKIGNRRYLEHARVIFDARGQRIAAVAAIHDVTAIREQESRLRILASALAQNPLPTVVLDAQPVITYANAAFSALFAERSAEALNACAIEQLIHPDDFANFAAGWSQVARGQQWQGNLRWQGTTANENPAAITITPIRDDDGAQRHFLLQQLP